MSDVFLDYDLPAELIAQEPVPVRDQSRLLVVDKAGRNFRHHHFHDLPTLLNPGDLLILNNTRVVPARLIGSRIGTGGKWEGLFLRETAAGLWELLTQTRGRLNAGERICIGSGPLELELIEKTLDRHWLVRPNLPGTATELLESHGQVPLPPYIRKGRQHQGDQERYQTVYAQSPGAVAAPTAGLHFTPAIFDRLRERGIHTAYVTLHVGLGTFQPLQTADYREHRMHAEWGELPQATAEAIVDCRGRGGRVVAVGTTSVRVLESAVTNGTVPPWSGETSLYIHPPFEFKVVDALITNFHLPNSTLLLLASAFAGVDLLRQAYNTAIAERYRFYSYGDAMLIA